MRSSGIPTFVPYQDERAAASGAPATTLGRASVEIILKRAVLLDPPQRALLEQVFARDMLTRDVARMTGQSVRNVQRQVRALVNRLTSPQAERIFRCRHRWDPITAHIAVAHCVRRRSMRRIARELDMSFYEVRRHVERVHGLINQPESRT